MAKSQKRKKKQKTGTSSQKVKAKNSALGQIIENKFGDLYLVGVNGNSFDAFGSAAFYKKAYGTQLFQEGLLYIFVGTDSGLLPEFIHGQGVPNDSRYLFIETDEVYAHLESLCPHEVFAPAIVVRPAAKLSETLAEPSLAAYIHNDKNLFFESVAAREATHRSYQELSSLVSNEWMDRIWQTKVAANQKDFIEKQLANLGENRVSSLCLQGAFKGETAVLLGGGPSLDDALPWIKANRDRLVILAISRVCRRLREVDLVPDIVFSVDPQPINYENSVDLFYFWQDSLFVHAHQVSPRLIAQWRGKSVYSGPRFPWPTPLNEKTLPLANPTVTNTALVSAVEMGFSKVILAGVDLCHSPDGQSHAQGNKERKVGANVYDKYIQVETYGGSFVKTVPAYANAIKELGQQAAEALRNGCQVVNTAANAAVVENISYQPISDIHCEKPAEEQVTQIFAMFAGSLSEQRHSHYLAMLAELQQGIVQLDELILLGKQAKEHLKGLLKTGQPEFHQRYLRELKQLESRLASDLADIFSTVKTFGAQEFLQLEAIDKDKGKAAVEQFQLNLQHYRVLEDAAEKLRNCCLDAEKRLNARCQEESQQVNFSLLKKQWLKDEQVGRALFWSDSHPDQLATMAAAEKKDLEKLRNRFHHYLNNYAADYNALKNVSNDHFMLLERSIAAFAEADQIGLQLLEQIVQQEAVPVHTGILLGTRSAPNEGSYLQQGYLPASQMSVQPDDMLYAYVCLPAANPPTAIMLQWQTTAGMHRAYWGEDNIEWGDADDEARVRIGPLPEIDQWVRLELPAKTVGLEGQEVLGFALFNDTGRAYWDITGTFSNSAEKVAWVEEGLDPAGALGKGWDWLGVAPYPGETMTARYFSGTSEPLQLDAGDRLYIDVCFDPAAPSSELMLQWISFDAEHRAYWGKNFIDWGEEGTEARYHAGPLPGAGDWVRLEVAAEAVGLEGEQVSGVSVILLNGRCFGRGLGKISAAGNEINWLADGLPAGAVLEGVGEGWSAWLDPGYEALKLLLAGYIAELQQDTEAALNTYHGLVGEEVWPPAMQQALLRIAALSLKQQDYDNALLAHQCLADISLEHQPRYAEFLVLVGEKQQAAEVYSQYLQRAPHDLETMLRLGKLYLEMQILEAARMAFQFVLEEEPNNQAAQTLLKDLEDAC